MYIEGSPVIIKKNVVFLSLKIDFVLAKAKPVVSSTLNK